MKSSPRVYANTSHGEMQLNVRTIQDGRAPSSALTARYGPTALAHGWAGVPTLLLEQRAALGLSAADALLVIDILSLWRGATPPAIATRTLAARMGCSAREIQRIVSRLRQVGLLLVTPVMDASGRQGANIYDPRPLLTAAAGIARLADATGDDERTATTSKPAVACRPPARAVSLRPVDSTPTAATQAPYTKDGAAVEGDTLAGRRMTPVSPLIKIEEKNSSSFRPPLPPTATVRDDERRNTPSTARVEDAENGADLIRTTIQALSVELGDAAPASSVTRALRLWREAGDTADDYLACLDEAAERTRARGSGIYRRDGAGGHNGIPYLLAVLADILAPDDRTRPARGPAPGDATHGRATTAMSAATEKASAGERSPAAASGTPAPSIRAAATEIELPETGSAVWTAALRELAQDVTRENMAMWFAPLHVVDETAQCLTLASPTAFGAQWVDGRLRRCVERALARVAEGVDYRVIIDTKTASGVAGATMMA